VVYVDSNSTDDSVAMARAAGAEVLELDMSTPFSAARARNAGFARLIQCQSQVEFVQFVDGDCEIAQDWLSTAAQVLSSRPELAVVAGWLNERFPEASIYNRIGEVEWNFSGAGEVESVGGVFMVRREAFESVGGFEVTLTAGEEPELCLRLRQKGWKILRLDHRMAWHDLAMIRFGQWWTRQVRNGYGIAYAGGRFDLPKFQRINLRVRAWAIWLVALPLVGVIAGIAAGMSAGLISFLFMLAIWPAQVVRVAIRDARRVNSWSFALVYAFFVMTAYFPQMVGQAKYFADRIRGRSNRLIEYKVVKSTARRSGD
jgi:glycosyltransferase involved in cell wall biosynthesis